jgi:hypothetical protein
MMLKHVVQQRQVGGLQQIIKIIGHGIICILYLCICGIHPLVCMVIPQLLNLILGVDLYVMEGCQIILLNNDQELKYFVLAMHIHVDEFIWPIF